MITGDTKISLVDGTEVPIKDLVGRDPFWTYSYDRKTGRIIPALATALKTRENSELVEVRLDNDEKVRCAPDHQWMLRDGSYQEAQDLTPTTSLMPLYRKRGRVQNELGESVYEYEELFQPGTEKYEFTHRSFVPGEKKEVVHHKNFNPYDNRPENLEWMTWVNHREIHAQLHFQCMVKYWSNPANRERISQSVVRWWDEHPEEREKVGLRTIEYWQTHPEVFEKFVQASKVYWGDPTHREEMSRGRMEFWNDPVNRGKLEMCIQATVEWWERNPEAKKEQSRRAINYFRDPIHREGVSRALKKRYSDHPELRMACSVRAKARVHCPVTCPTCLREFKDKCGLSNHLRRKVKCAPPTNHKVVSVAGLSSREDTYRLLVSNYHNFALSSGVFVTSEGNE